MADIAEQVSNRLRRPLRRTEGGYPKDPRFDSTWS